MNLSEMKQWMAEGDIRLTRSLGQSFLHDGNQVRKIVSAAELGEDDRVIEIGPGLGPLTELLIGHRRQVLAIEKDARLVEVVKKRFGESLELLHDDALDYLRRERRDWSEWKVVSNLPYSVASPILVELAYAPRCPERMIVTLQIEVAQRLMAEPGDADYGLLTLLMQLHYEAKDWFRISASCFFPVPDVDSACATLLRRETPLLPQDEAETFRRVVKRGFSQRRKMMFKLLKEDWTATAVETAFRESGIGAQARAETVSLEQFVRLTRTLAASSAHA